MMADGFQQMNQRVSWESSVKDPAQVKVLGKEIGSSSYGNSVLEVRSSLSHWRFPCITVHPDGSRFKASATATEWFHERSQS